ncbi:hypothetical protein BDN72DRAFT_887409 [Pluteus cervinus]|uniref:Uncharacterized protein n=1 Tax=Pluteus cervinus TaxID=181527 RepID=A0ACD3B1Y7_9AGAR|nr:hypothetical protein BDN72DRAFT_887409 [Pluteus cervinus]
MEVDDPLTKMKNSLQDALDQLCSPKSTSETRGTAIQTLEKWLAMACLPNSDQASENLDYFIALQYTFECNIPSRLLNWITTSTLKLEFLTNKGSMDEEREADAMHLSSQLAAALTLIQGIALHHPATKVWLGRKYPLEILLELLMASRHLSSIAVPNPGLSSDLHGRPITPTTPLSSVVLDTLLCILVDSPAALRVFEEVQGVNVAVRILKRAGTPREVRMKCLEFLYFYLLDEAPDASASLVATPPTSPITPSQAHPAPPVMQTPVRPPSKKPYLNGFTPNLPPSSRQSSASSLSPHTPSGSSSIAFTGLSTASNPPSGASASSRSTSGSSTTSFSSSSSGASSSTGASSVAPLSRNSSHEKVVLAHSQHTKDGPSTPPNSPPLRSSGLPTSSLRHSKTHGQLQIQPRSLHMLRKEVDYVPQSPKKPSSGSIERRTPATPGTGIMDTPIASKTYRLASHGPGSERKLGHIRGKSLSSLSRTPSSKLSPKQLEVDDAENICRDLGPAFIPERDGDRVGKSTKGNDHMRSGSSSGGLQELRRKTTEEKKEYLGTMLGNVDALVEGVRKAGIWGLG